MTNAGADGGVDIWIERSGKKAAVQCKKQKGTVSVKVVRGLFGVMKKSRSVEGFIATTASFSRGAEDFAKGTRITLLDGRVVVEMVHAERSQRV
jgi:restriction system protein